MELWIDSDEWKPCRIHKNLRTNPSIFQMIRIKTTRSTNPSMSNILNNIFSCNLGEPTTKLPAASDSWKAIDKFRLLEVFHEEIELCAKINAVFWLIRRVKGSLREKKTVLARRHTKRFLIKITWKNI